MTKGGLIDLIYDKSKYKIDKAPNFIYMPKKIMVFNMMKACIGVTEIKDLWIYNN